MAKIMIYEDETEDLVNRYSKLTKNHDVHVCIVGSMSNALKETWLKDKLQESGFNMSKVKGVAYANRIGNPNWESEYVEIPPSDVYFTDGLSGGCFDILKRLPKEKAYLLTTSEDIEEKAIEKGYQLASGDLEEIIQKTLSK